MYSTNLWENVKSHICQWCTNQYLIQFFSTEEVLNAEYALYFSKNGKFLTYIEFDDSNVKDFVFPWYGSSSNEYTKQHRIAYPKPGTPNPLIKVKVIDLSTPGGAAIEVPKPSEISKG